MYTGAPRRAFQLPVAHEVEPKACTRRLWLPLYASMREFGPCKDVITGHNIGKSLLLSTNVWILFSPPIERPETRPTA